MKKDGADMANATFGNDKLLNLVLSFLKDPCDCFAACLVAKRWLEAESFARRECHVIRSANLQKIATRFPNLESVSFAKCRSIFDEQAEAICRTYGAKLQELNFCANKGITSAALRAIGQHCSNLTTLDLSNCHNEDFPIDDHGPAALAGCKNLKVLKLTGCKAITDEGLASVAKHLKGLVELTLRWCSGISDEGIKSLANHPLGCTRLEVLDLSYTQVTDEGLRALAEVPSLRSLSLVSCLAITDTGLAQIGRGNTRLRALDISSCQGITDDGVASLCATSSSLQELHVCYCPGVSESALTSVHLLGDLRVLKLDGITVNNIGLQFLGQGCPRLQDLSLFRCGGVTDEGLSAIADGCEANLQKLDITCCSAVTGVSFSSLANRCRGLRSLRMEGCREVNSAGLTVVSALCKGLEELDLTDCDISNAALAPVATCANLKILKVGFNLGLTDAGFALLAKKGSCPNLAEFDAYRCESISDQGFLAVLKHRGASLRRLNLSYCQQLTDLTLDGMGQCTGLTSVELRGCLRFTSAGLKALASGCTRLVELDLKRSAVDDKGLVEVAKYCWRLRELQLSFTGVTDAGIEAALACPALQVLRILCCERITARSVSLAARRCQALRKIKLNQSLKATIPAEDIATLDRQFVTLKWLQK